MNNVIKKGYNFCKNIVVLLMLVCATNVLPKKMASVEKERQKEAKRAGIQEINLRERETNQTPDVYTQTQAHVQIKKLRALIQDNFGDKSRFKSDKVVPFFDIISRMVTKEAELKDTHYVFYHAAPTMLAIMMDLFTQLYFNEHPDERATADDAFRFLRFQGQSTGLTAQQFVENELRAHGLIDDKTDKLMAILLSVNLSLFGSVGSKTESTWLRFLDNRRSLAKWQQDEFETMMEHFGLTTKYVKEIMALDDLFATTPEAMMLQIFVPKELVDQFVYLAWIRGIPASDPIMEWIKEYQSSEAVPNIFEVGKKKEQQRGALEHIAMSREKLAEIFKKEQEKNPIFKQFMEELKAGEFSAYAFLRAYCSTPREVPYLNDTQGRMLFTKEGLLNPSSRIKFFSYFSTPREKLEEYTVKLNEIIKKLIAEKGGQKVEAPQLKPTAKPMPSPVKPQPASAITPKQIVTPAKPKQIPMVRPTRQIQRLKPAVPRQ